MSQQIADSGVATFPDEVEEEDWKDFSIAFCHGVLNIDDYPEYETADDLLVDEGFDEFWDREERDTVARIMSAKVLLQSRVEGPRTPEFHFSMVSATQRSQAVSKTRLTITASGFGCP